MNIKLFYHSLLSDWNHGNAHFLRGICTELIARGHRVEVLEPENNWSLSNLIKEYGKKPVQEFSKYFPSLKNRFYNLETLDLKGVLEGTDLVIVHEWNDPELVKRIGNYKKENSYFKLLFHDTHYRAVTESASMTHYDLSGYDGVLAIGDVIKEIYLKNNWASRAWTWHEAADTSIFYPRPATKEGDLVWIGNWGDEERTDAMHEFLIEPVKALRIKARVYGVRYPQKAIKALIKAGIEYGGWLANYKAPEVLAKYKLTVHVPRTHYAEALPGIPTIKPFEAMACGIPLISAPWKDLENLFTPSKDFLQVKSGKEMKEKIKYLLSNKEKAAAITKHALNTIKGKHTCKHRVDQLLEIYNELQKDKVVNQEKSLILS